MNKRGQITIFVILGLVLVATITIIFLALKGPSVTSGAETEPGQFIDKCARESVQKTTDIIISQGGFVNPKDFKIYKDIKSTYLCKNVNFYLPCITQYPLYLSKIESEIENNIREDIENCFIELEDELRKRNYEVSVDGMEIEAKIKPKLIEIDVLRDFSYNKAENSNRIESFKIVQNSPLYELAYVANEISSQEAKFCYFDYIGYMALNTGFDIRKQAMSDSTKIYIIKNKQTGHEMNIAVRGCAIPAGF